MHPIERPDVVISRYDRGPSAESLRGFIARGLDVETLQPSGKESFYGVTAGKAIVGGARLIIDPAASKLEQYHIDPAILDEHRTGILSGVYVNPAWRGRNVRLHGKSIAKHLLALREQEAWRRGVDVLVTLSRPDSQRIFNRLPGYHDAGDHFALVGDQTMHRKVYFRTRPAGSLDAQVLAQTYFSPQLAPAIYKEPSPQGMEVA